MGLEIDSIQPGARGIENMNILYESLQGLPGFTVENIGLGSIDTNITLQLHDAMGIFPAEYRSGLVDGKVPNLHAGLIESLDKNASTGLIILSGAGGSGPGITHMVAEWIKAAGQRNLISKIGMGLGIGPRPV